MADIRCVVAEVIWRESQMCAEKRSADFCDKLLRRQRMRAEPLGHIAPNTMCGAGRMDGLMVQRRCIMIG